ncbi:conserved hypothetical protein [Vibrio campbellii HY01]|nr:conserved hypothetical protein [Vibrio campbellii HY01]
MEAFAHFHGACLNQYLWFAMFVLMLVIFEGSCEISELFPSLVSPFFDFRAGNPSVEWY